MFPTWFLGIISGPKAGGPAPFCPPSIRSVRNDVVRSPCGWNPATNEIWTIAYPYDTPPYDMIGFRYDAETLENKGTIVSANPDVVISQAVEVYSFGLRESWVYDASRNAMWAPVGRANQAAMQWLFKVDATTGAVLAAKKPVVATNDASDWRVHIHPVTNELWMSVFSTLPYSTTLYRLDPTTHQPVETYAITSGADSAGTAGGDFMDAAGNIWYITKDATTFQFKYLRKFDMTTKTLSGPLYTHASSFQWYVRDTIRNTVYLISSTSTLTEVSLVDGTATGRVLTAPLYSGFFNLQHDSVNDVIWGAGWSENPGGKFTGIRASDGTAYGTMEAAYPYLFEHYHQQNLMVPRAGMPPSLYFVDYTASTTDQYHMNKVDVCNRLLPGETLPPPPPEPYGLVFEGNVDDDYSVLPPAAFSFKFFGKDMQTLATYVGSNSYTTFGVGVTAYQYSSQIAPSYWTSRGTPAIVAGSTDRSVQRIYAGTMPDGTYKIRFEGDYTTSGTAGSPTVWWELVFKDDHTFTLFSDATAGAAATSFYASNSAWAIMSGTSSDPLPHGYNSGNDANFNIPMAKGQTYKFTAADADGNAWSMVLV